MHSTGSAPASVLRPPVSKGGASKVEASIAGAPVLQVSLAHRIETPENVVLTYQLAGPSVRLMAYLLDLMILISVMSVLSCVIAILFESLGLPGLGIGMALVLIFIGYWWFFALSEWLFRGRTIGKQLMRLQVIQDQGYPLTFQAAVLRNFLRLADLAPPYVILPTCLAGFTSMLVSGKFQRLGDLFARTLVIEESRVAVPTEPIILERIQPLSRTDIGGFVPAPRTLTLIEQFLGRRHALSYKRGHEMASILARSLAVRLNFQGDPKYLEKYPMAFLASVYATFHRTLDEDAEFGGADMSAERRSGTARRPAGPRPVMRPERTA